jgi:hypothetical protein
MPSMTAELQYQTRLRFLMKTLARGGTSLDDVQADIVARGSLSVD